jgi:hypothetical protein
MNFLNLNHASSFQLNSAQSGSSDFGSHPVSKKFTNPVIGTFRMLKVWTSISSSNSSSGTTSIVLHPVFSCWRSENPDISDNLKLLPRLTGDILHDALELMEPNNLQTKIGKGLKSPTEMHFIY